jgi:UDP-GlcNAc:undecaprenyl-phosphate GlcNAc-1-phosphate transferase
MRTYFAAFFIALLSAALLTPPTRRLAMRFGAVSRPGGRHVHLSVVPRMGGVAIYVAFLLPLGGLFFVDSSVAHIVRADAWKAGGLLIGATAMALVGVVDDTRGLPALVKLGAQLAVASFAFACGFRIDSVSVPLLGNLSMGVFAFPMTLLWISGIMNAVNLIDGLDGLAAGIVLFAGLTNFAIACIAGSVFIAVVTAAMIGAVLGFLVFNFNPARIFMGDSGSYMLGYVLGTTVIVGASQKASTAVALLVPCLAMGVPIFDTLFSMVRRYLERRPIFSPDRGHIHHRLLDMGLTHRRAVLTIYAASALFSLAAIATSIGRGWQVGLALLASSAVLFALVRAAGYIEYLRHYVRGRGRIHTPRTEAIRRALPDFAERLAVVADESAVKAALDDLRRALAFDQVTLIERSSGMRRPSLRPKAARGDTDIMEACFLVGSDALARSSVLFAWSGSEGGATPGMEILLEVLTDLVERALVRVDSSLGPAKAPPAGLNQVPSSVRASQVVVSPSTLRS